MKKGDHLRVKLGMYHHHGIDRGDGYVIHFSRGIHDIANAKVESVSREVFSMGRRIDVVDAEAGYSADQIIQRAESRLDELRVRPVRQQLRTFCDLVQDRQVQ